MVTHNIAEAVSMADRLLVFSANPGRIRVELPGLPRSVRGRESLQQAALVDTIYRIMTNPQEEVARLLPGARAVQPAAVAPSYQMLPHVSIGDLTGFIERLHALGDREDLYELAADLQLDADELLPIAEAADLLGLGDIEQGDVLLTTAGRKFAEADVLEEKEIFRRQVLGNVALIREIAPRLDEAEEHRIREEPLLRELERWFSPEEARRQLDTAIDWGRYAELFAYDDDTGEFFLEQAPVASDQETAQGA
jgi:NitT/TauT family transport system ATP-binding protein